VFVSLCAALFLCGSFATSTVDARAKVAAAKVERDAGVAATKVLTTARTTATALAASSQPVKPDDVQGVSGVVRDAMRTSNWRLVVIGGLLLAVLLLRRIGGFCLPPKGAAWVSSDRGGAALAIAAGVLTVVVNGMVAGGKFDPQLLIDGALAAATAAGGFNLVKRLAAPSDKPQSPTA
jgi:hypothetical protein